MEIQAMVLTQTTMAGPVGILGIKELAVVPKIPERAPKNADKATIRPSLWVHCLAATAGAMSMALIRITPTV